MADNSHGASAIPRTAIERFLSFAQLGGDNSDDDDTEEDGVRLHRAGTGALPFQALETERGAPVQHGPPWVPRLREWVVRWRLPLAVAAVGVAVVAGVVGVALSLTKGGGGGGGGAQGARHRNRVPPWTELPAGASLCPGVSKPFKVASSVGLDPTQPLPPELFTVPRNPRYQVPERAPTPEEIATTYNNFYEFTTHKNVAEVIGNHTGMFSPNAGWTVTLDGLVEEPGRNLTLAALLASVGPLEERLYRLRCVEAWSMSIPWVGFPLCRLLDLARPLPSARYVRMESFFAPGDAPGQAGARGAGPWAWPWPYTEALTMEEARNEMALLVVGSYGRVLRPQSGAPLRLVVPWKYGFKSVKSIVRFTFTAERPATFWGTSGPQEYGFWANVNPEAPHKRWSQASERQIPEGQQVPSKLFNGYEEFVGYLYDGLEGEDLYHR